MSTKKQCGSRLFAFFGRHFAAFRGVLVALLDILLLTGSSLLVFTLACFQWGGFSLVSSDTPLPSHFWLWQFLLLTACVVAFLIVFRVQNSLWRYASTHEYLMLLAAGGCGYALYSLLAYWVWRQAMPPALALLTVALAVLLMLVVRLLYRQYREVKTAHKLPSRHGDPVVIVGAGGAGAMVLDEFARNKRNTLHPVCMVDDDPAKIGCVLHGLPIEGPISRLPDILTQYRAHEVLIAIPSADKLRLREIFDICTNTGCRVRVLPDLLALSNKSSLLQQARAVSVEDLLGRETVSLTGDELPALIRDKVVMVTGGGGSIGSELCRQIAKHHPRRLVIVDIYENYAYDIQQELRNQYADSLDLCVEIASVRDAHKVDLLFARYQPQIVLHAAAHKHVPLMEHCPEEAVRNNVFGTYNVVTAADRHRVERFILVSTDKAVNPTNVMGATKRLCEMIVQSMATISNTQYAAVRFGNVLGSNGSVIPLFQRQINNGGPVTLTDKRIIRYFMTIPEAAQLVLLAGAMAQRNEIFVLDMGSPVRILELAENLIRLSGFTPYEDIDIVETGLRPGEKLYEELLTRSEELTDTTNRKIFIERQIHPVTPEELQDKFRQLEEALATDDAAVLVETMHRIVPTFRTAEEVNAQAIADLDYSKVHHQ